MDIDPINNNNNKALMTKDMRIDTPEKKENDLIPSIIDSTEKSQEEFPLITMKHINITIKINPKQSTENCKTQTQSP